MSELTRPARALLQAAHAARTPSDRDRERVFAAMLAASMAQGAGMPAMQQARLPVLQGLPPSPPLPPPVTDSIAMPVPRAAERAPARATSTLRPPGPTDRVVLSWFAASLGAVALGVAVYFVAGAAAAPREAEVTPAVTVERAVATAVGAPAAAAEAAPEAAAEAAPAAPEPKPAAVVASAARAEATSSASKPSGAAGARKRGRYVRIPARRGSEDGAKILFAADSAYRAGDPQRAYELVQAHEKRYPSSGLNIERNALRAQLLCQLGKVQAARRVVLELEADHASENVLDAVGEACTNL